MKQTQCHCTQKIYWETHSKIYTFTEKIHDLPPTTVKKKANPQVRITGINVAYHFQD